MPYARRRISRSTRRPAARRRVARGAYRRKRAPARRTGAFRRVLKLAAGLDLPEHIGVHRLAAALPVAKTKPTGGGSYADFQAMTSTPEYFLQAAEIHMPGYQATASWIPMDIKRKINFNPAMYKDAIWAMSTGAQIGFFAGWTVPELLASQGAQQAIAMADIFQTYYSDPQIIAQGTTFTGDMKYVLREAFSMAAAKVPKTLQKLVGSVGSDPNAAFLDEMVNIISRSSPQMGSSMSTTANAIRRSLVRPGPVPTLGYYQPRAQIPLPISQGLPEPFDWTDYINMEAHEYFPAQPAWMSDPANLNYLSQGI